MPLDVIGIIGIILLIGIVKKNGIMLIDFVLERRHPRGVPSALPPYPDDIALRFARQRPAYGRNGNGFGNSPDDLRGGERVLEGTGVSNFTVGNAKETTCPHCPTPSGLETSRRQTEL
jgi:hypothetical protein